MSGWRGATGNLGHRTHRTRALDVGTDPRGFADSSDYDSTRGIPRSAAPGTQSDGLAEVMGQIKAPPMTTQRKPAGRVGGK